MGEVTADAGQRVVIEYRARYKSGNQYVNLCMSNNQANQFAMAVAFEGSNNQRKIVVQNGSGDSNKVKVKDFVDDTWYSFKIVANLDAQTYDAYLVGTDGDELIASGYKFRCSTTATSLINHRFGCDKADAQVDFDDFKVSVVSVDTSEEVGP